jgi:branched-chain amino acid transport system permease protein
MTNKQSSIWVTAIKYGLIGGAISLLLSLIGLVDTFSERYIVYNVITLGQLFFLLPLLLYGYIAALKAGQASPITRLGLGGLAGLVGAIILALLVFVGQLYPQIRDMFQNASSDLFAILTFDQPLPLGYLYTLGAGLICGILGSGLNLLPARLRSAVIQGFVWVILLGMMRDLLVTVIRRWGPAQDFLLWLFGPSGMSLIGALAVFIGISALSYWRAGQPQAPRKESLAARNPAVRYSAIAVGIVILLFLPQILGLFFSEILDNTGLYILMALGLNIVVGYAGLLDLGYVAFFAIGAYTMGVLTSPELGIGNLTYFQALPFALGMAVLFGIILGLPVLKVRGDYLAIVTLGFGEIVRLMVLSDWLRPFLGGSQGIQVIAQPAIGPFAFDTLQRLYYLILLGCALAAFITYRLRDSRIGRAWSALREDEDVAQAIGINTVLTKLLAFATGAFFAGLAGTMFAAKLTSAYPDSFNFLVSINVLSIIIIGGIGSVPGVLVGALVLVGLPQLLREFAEYRLLVYGAVLVAMMQLRPEGLWPEARRRLELHEESLLELEIVGEPQPAIDNPGK